MTITLETEAERDLWLATHKAASAQRWHDMPDGTTVEAVPDGKADAAVQAYRERLPSGDAPHQDDGLPAAGFRADDLAEVMGCDPSEGPHTWNDLLAELRLRLGGGDAPQEPSAEAREPHTEGLAMEPCSYAPLGYSLRWTQASERWHWRHDSGDIGEPWYHRADAANDAARDMRVRLTGQLDEMRERYHEAERRACEARSVTTDGDAWVWSDDDSAASVDTLGDRMVVRITGGHLRALMAASRPPGGAEPRELADLVKVERCTPGDAGLRSRLEAVLDRWAPSGFAPGLLDEIREALGHEHRPALPRVRKLSPEDLATADAESAARHEGTPSAVPDAPGWWWLTAGDEDPWPARVLRLEGTGELYAGAGWPVTSERFSWGGRCTPGDAELRARIEAALDNLTEQASRIIADYTGRLDHPMRHYGSGLGSAVDSIRAALEEPTNG